MSEAVASDRGHALTAIFGRAKGVLIGVVHLLPLLGSPNYRSALKMDGRWRNAVDRERAKR
jgi:predicted TIM-barrel enzyme